MGDAVSIDLDAEIQAAAETLVRWHAVPAMRNSRHNALFHMEAAYHRLRRMRDEEIALQSVAK